VSWGLLALSVIWGLALSTRALGRRPRANWLLDLHRFLGGLAVIFVAVHLVGLAFDHWVDIGLRQMLVPFTSSWNPMAVSWGVVALYLLVAIELTSLVRKRLPKRFWKGIHLTSYGLYVIATVHMFTAGTDAGSTYLQWAAVVATAVIVFFTAYRVMGPDRAESTGGGQPSHAVRLAAARAEAARQRVGAAPR
jgi:DMSO/TMAO reductase YedYZ heme-binding membrane subunit